MPVPAKATKTSQRCGHAFEGRKQILPSLLGIHAQRRWEKQMQESVRWQFSGQWHLLPTFFVHESVHPTTTVPCKMRAFHVFSIFEVKLKKIQARQAVPCTPCVVFRISTVLGDRDKYWQSGRPLCSPMRSGGNNHKHGNKWHHWILA